MNSRLLVGDVSIAQPFKNAANPLTISTYDGGGQTIEQDILDMQIEGLGIITTFAGHRYWMITAPYPNNDDTKENPSIYYSDDGVTWTVPAGVTNPLVAAPIDGTPGNSDPGLVYDPVNKLLRVYYRVDNSVIDAVWELHSTDGVNWSTPQRVMTFARPERNLMPTIVYDKSTKQYLQWWVDAGVASVNYIARATSPDGINWTTSGGCGSRVPNGYHYWHINIKPYKDHYIGIMNAYITGQNTDGAIFFMESIDSTGNGWDIRPTPILIASGGSNWDGTTLYQSCLRYVNNQWWLWYTGRYNNAGTYTNKMGLIKLTS